jgi:hypothetical protein
MTRPPSATGERLGNGTVFETGHGRRDLITPQRRPVLADPNADPGTDPGTGVPYGTAAVADAAREAMGLPAPGSAARSRERFTERRTEAALNAALSGRGLARRPDDFESPRERRERIAAQRGAVQPREFGEPPVCGSLGQFDVG